VKLGTFQSTLKPISMVYPQDWEARDTPGGYHNDKEAIVMMQIMFHDYPFVRIRSQPMPEATLTDVAAWGEKRILDGLFRESTYKTAPLEPIELNGHPALRRSFEYKLFDTITCQQIYLLDDEDAYTIELCIDLASDSPEVPQLFTEMIESIKLNSPS
jgi:hypothetical protein